MRTSLFTELNEKLNYQIKSNLFATKQMNNFLGLEMCIPIPSYSYEVIPVSFPIPGYF